jgi:hypothetical protein
MCYLCPTHHIILGLISVNSIVWKVQIVQLYILSTQPNKTSTGLYFHKDRRDAAMYSYLLFFKHVLCNPSKIMLIEYTSAFRLL